MNQRQWIPMDISSGAVNRQISRLHWTTVGVVTITLLLVGFLVSQPLPLGAIGFVASLLFMRQIRSAAGRNGLEGISTHPADEFDQARIFNVVEGLCVVSGDARPAIEIAETFFPLAAVVGASGNATIVVSDSFCNAMDRVETEAVMAHLLWRIRSGDADMTAYLRSLSMSFSRIGLQAIARLIIGRIANPESLVWADIAACQATRYPPAVASALEKIDTTQEPLPNTSSVSQWFALPDEVDNATIRDPFVSNVGFSRPSIADRVGILKEM
jgi:heat shock protein HtpX